MNRLCFALGIASGCALVAVAPLQARTCSLESFGCLFALSRPIPSAETMFLFSLAPFAGRLAVRQSAPPPPVPEVTDAPREESVSTEDSNSPRAQFVSTYIRPPLAPLATEGAEQWPVFEALHRWQSNPQVPGLSHTFADTNSFMALDYSDIFETHRAPYKGGHGVSLFFQHNF